MASGVLLGLFLGELCAPLKVVGDAFVGLLQMTVLPYLAISLIRSIGRLDVGKGKRLVLAAAVVLLGLWAIGLLVITLMPSALPPWDEGSFFSVSQVDETTTIDLHALFIPSNVFRSLADNLVPAVVVFCIFLGIALMQLENRNLLLDQLAVIDRALARVNKFVVKFTPIGVFAIAASTAGTISFEEFARLQVYFIIYLGAILILALGVLPVLITCLTPFTYREVMRVAQTPMITAFATGKVLVVLPMLTENTKDLLREYEERHPGVNGSVEMLFPLGYPFPKLGKMMSMLFIPFAAWYAGKAMTLGQYPTFCLAGLFCYFGGSTIATPFLLNLMDLPIDLFQLFLVARVFTDPFGDPLGVMHLLAFTLIAAGWSHGFLRVKLRRLLVSGTILVGSLVVLLVGARAGLARSLASLEPKRDIIARMQLITDPVEYEVLKTLTPPPLPSDPTKPRLRRIRERGTIRIGYREDNLPFSFRNEKGQLVGFDVNMAHYLARDLRVKIEFVPFRPDTLIDQLNADRIDVAMSGIQGRWRLAEYAAYTDPYLMVRMSLVVRDRDVDDYATIASIREMDSPRVGVSQFAEAVRERARELVPNATVVELQSPREFFEHKGVRIDALLIDAESGSAWTLLYPEYQVVIPDEMKTRRLPVVCPVGGGDTDFATIINRWISLRKYDGTLDALYDYWILGRTRQKDGRRWCIARDVLGWLE